MKTYNRTHIGAGVVLVLALGAGIFWSLVAGESPGFPADFGFSFPGNKEYEYRLEFSASTETVPEPVARGATPNAANPADGRGAIGLSGRLLAHGRGRDAKSGGWYVEYRVAEVSGVEFVVQGMPVPINDLAKEEIEAGRAIVLMTPSGEIRKLWFGEKTELFVRQILRPLVMELQTVIQRETPAWESSQDGYNGRAQVAYALGSRNDATSRSLRGRVLSYNPLRTVRPELRSTPPVIKSALLADINLEGYMEKLEADVGVEVAGEGGLVRSKVKVRAQLMRVAEVKASPLGGAALVKMDVLTPGEIPGEREAVEDMKRNRVAGYTFEQLQADLLAYGAAGEMPNHRQWIYRTVGLLLLKPETCAQLAKAWSEPGLSDGAHNLIVDVLANAGSAEAQKALREILGSEQAWKDNNFQRLVQSMTLLREPNVESVAFLESLSTAVKQPAGQAAAVISFGSGIGKLYARGEVQEAEKFNRTIRRLAQSASTSGQKQGVLYAIGNTGMDSNLSLLGDFISSPDDNIRATSARALRNFKGGDARSSLRLMTVDPSPLVQREAIRALRNNGISTEDVGALLVGVRSGEIDTSTLPGLMRALSTSLKEGVNSGIMLDALRSRAGNDRDLLRQINELAMELQR